MTKYLKLDGVDGELTIVEQRPTAPYVEYKNVNYFGGKFGVYHDNFARIDEALARIQTLSGCGEMIKAAQYAALQLAQKYDAEGTLFVSLGASPKIIKWALDCYGFKVVNVNASAMTKLADDAAPTQDFIDYVERKLNKLFKPTKIVLMDFADTGKSLRVMRNMILNHVPHMRDVQVIMAATGTGLEFEHEEGGDDKIKPLVGYVVKNHLNMQMSMEILKNDWFGRNKLKNDYATWNAAQSQQKAMDTMKNSHTNIFKDRVQSELYGQQKNFVKHVMASKQTAPILFDGDSNEEADEKLTTELKSLSSEMHKPRLRSSAHMYHEFVPCNADNGQ